MTFSSDDSAQILGLFRGQYNVSSEQFLIEDTAQILGLFRGDYNSGSGFSLQEAAATLGVNLLDDDGSFSVSDAYNILRLPDG